MIRHTIEEAHDVRIAPDGSLAVATAKAVLRVDAKTGKSKAIAKLDYPGPLVFAGSRLYVGVHKKIVAFEGTKKLDVKMSVNGDGVMSIAPSPDGTIVLCNGNDEGGILKCYDVGKPRARYTLGSQRYARIVWFADGKRFVTATSEWVSRIRVHDIAKGELVEDIGDPHGKSKGDKHPLIDDIALVGEALYVGSYYGLGVMAPKAKSKISWIVTKTKVMNVVATATGVVAACAGGKVLVVDGTTVSATHDIGGDVIALDASAAMIAACVDGAVVVIPR